MKTWGLWDVFRERWLTNPGQLTERQARLAMLVLGALRFEARRQPEQ